jgi:hypothetical protein
LLSDTRTINDPSHPAAIAGWTWKGVRVPDSAQNYEGYCVKCKEKRNYEGEVRISESGRRMARGTCPVCGSTINRILGKA